MAELSRDGVRLVYEEAGSGGPPLLFVHGFGGDGRHFAPQLEHFARSRRVVAIDRRGHGKSAKVEGPYTIPAIAEEVAWTARELGLHKPIVVVHSMGPIGFELAATHPDLASALVVIDAPAFVPPPVRATFEGLLEGLRSPSYRAAIDAACDAMIFLPTDDRTRRARLHAAMLETPQHVLASTWAHFLAHDAEAAIRATKVPVLFISAVMPVDEARLREACPGVMFGRTVGAGHFPQLEVPEQVNAMIARFLHVAHL